MIYVVEVDSYGMVYLPSFIKTGTGVEAILTFYLRNFRRFNVGNAGRRDL
jgi:hypothetical protein